jgi:hypothetical protein
MSSSESFRILPSASELFRVLISAYEFSRMKISALLPTQRVPKNDDTPTQDLPLPFESPPPHAKDCKNIRPIPIAQFPTLVPPLFMYDFHDIYISLACKNISSLFTITIKSLKIRGKNGHLTIRKLTF